jgi:glycosyltransferase involved in cell wall biosynthesis
VALPDVGVVVPTSGQRTRLLQRAVAAVLADPGTSEVIIVVDSDDTGVQEAIISELPDERIRTTQLDSGASGDQLARDRGVELASSEVILAIDDDVIAGPALVSGHAHWHAGHDDRVVLGFMPVEPPPPGRHWSAGTRLYATSYARACQRFAADSGMILTGLWGGNLSVRRTHWLNANRYDRLDVSFPHPDQEFGLRLRRLGLHPVFDPTLRASHHVERTLARIVADARGSARAQVQLHAAYPDLIPDPRTRRAGGWKAATSRALATASRNDVVWRWTLDRLTTLADAAAAGSLPSAEYALARLMRRLSYDRELRSLR